MKLMNNKYDDFTALKRHIESINHYNQIKMCKRTMSRFYRKYKDSYLSSILKETLMTTLKKRGIPHPSFMGRK
jgi:hypothetical protein